ncbi:hypothetical protein [Galactobacter valiniphilus]|uniref:hypothetical protein n=1 Tax=Galactobacter valiniphilus TaxID=2676122 RepID=UPI003736FF65
MTNQTPQGTPEDDGLIQFIEANRGDKRDADLIRLADGKLGRTYFTVLRKQGISAFPGATVIEGLAQALDVKVSEVVLAAARSLGLPAYSTTSRDLVLYGAGELPIDSQRLLIETATNLLGWQERVDQLTPTPASEPDWTQADFDQAADEQRELTRDQRWEQQHGGRGEESQLGPDED